MGSKSAVNWRWPALKPSSGAASSEPALKTFSLMTQSERSRSSTWSSHAESWASSGLSILSSLSPSRSQISSLKKVLARPTQSRVLP